MNKVIKYVLIFLSGVLIASLFFMSLRRETEGSKSDNSFVQKKSHASVEYRKNSKTLFFGQNIGRFDALKRYEDDVRGGNWSENLDQQRMLFSSNEGAEYCKLFFELWSAEDPDAAFEAAQNPVNRMFSRVSLSAVLRQVRTDDGAKALSMLSKLPVTHHVKSISAEFFSEWASLSLNDLLLSAEKIEDITHRKNALKAVGRSLVERSPSEAIEWLEGISSLDEDDSIVSSVLSEWAKTRPFDALAYVEENGLDVSLNRSVIDVWVKSNPEDAIGWISSVPEFRDKNSLMLSSMLALQESNFSSSEMLGFLGVLPAGRMKDQALQVLMQNWQGSNFDEIASEMYFSKSSVSGTPGERKIAEKWVKSDLEGVERYLRENPENEKIKFLRIKFFEEKVKREPFEALRLVDDMKKARSNILLRNVAQSLLETDYKTAEAFVGSLIDTPNFDQHISDFSRAYGAKNPELALNWVTENLTGSELENGVSSSFEGWVSIDEYEAAKYIGNMAPSVSRDIATSVLVESLLESDFASAVEWSTTIQGVGHKRAIFESIREKLGGDPSQEQLDIILSGTLTENEIRLLEVN